MKKFDYLNTMPSNNSYITTDFIEEWKRGFEHLADDLLSSTSYHPVPTTDIAEKLGCNLLPIPKPSLEQTNEHGDKLIALFSMEESPSICLKASYEKVEARVPDYRISKGSRYVMEEESEEEKLVLSRRVDEGRANRFVTAYYSAVALILRRNPHLSHPFYHVMYEGYNDADSYLGGLPFYFAMQVLVNDKTLAGKDLNNMVQLEHYLSVDRAIIDKKLSGYTPLSKSESARQIGNLRTLEGGQITFLPEEYTAGHK